MKQLFYLLLVMSCSLLSFAQDTSHAKSLDALKQIVQQQSSNPVSLQRLQAPDSVSREQMAALQQAYTETRLFAYKHIQRTYEWNYTSTLIIFWMVILLVVSGLIFSAVQFYKSVVETRRNKQTPETSTIEASLQGIKVTSSVLGVIILVISMLFFYLYLAHVYPVITVPK